MKTDSIFYQIFQTFPGLVFELIGEPVTEENAYRFESVEIKETIKRIDGVLMPRRGSERPIGFVEVQFQVDKDFYYRFFTEIFLYLGQKRAKRDWLGVAIFARRSIEPTVPVPYRRLIENQHVRRVYLDELGEIPNQSVGLGTVQLAIAPPDTARPLVRPLIQKAQTELEDETLRRKVLELVETILVYKFSQLSREEIEAMFGLSDLKQTKVYQEGKVEGKLESVPRLARLGLTVEQIAAALELDIEVVRKAAEGGSDN